MEVTAGEASSAAAAGEGGSNHQSSSSGGLQQPEQEAAYAVKRVRFFGREVPIFLQNLNGPCPLLSIANVLSLRNELKLPSRKAREVSQSQLITLVAERLLEAGTPVTKANIDAYRPDDDAAQQRQAWHAEYISRILRIVHQELEALQATDDVSPEDLADKMAAA